MNLPVLPVLGATFLVEQVLPRWEGALAHLAWAEAQMRVVRPE